MDADQSLVDVLTAAGHSLTHGLLLDCPTV